MLLLIAHALLLTAHRSLLIAHKIVSLLPAYTKFWLDRTNKKLFIIASFSLECFLVIVYHASKKFDSDLELDAVMHKIKRATRDMMKNVGVVVNFHHKITLNAMVSRFIGNAKLTAAMISFFQDQ